MDRFLIFISSVQKELAEDRHAVKSFIENDPLLRRFFTVFLFEDLPARKSDYGEYARWAEALFELDKDEYRALITRWRKKHDRRRNLWRAFENQRLLCNWSKSA